LRSLGPYSFVELHLYDNISIRFGSQAGEIVDVRAEGLIAGREGTPFELADIAANAPLDLVRKM